MFRTAERREIVDQEPGLSCGFAGPFPRLPRVRDPLPGERALEVREEPRDHALGCPLDLADPCDLAIEHCP
jgi:hypothetical protein